MTHAELIRQTSLISRIAAQYTHELAFGVWNPDFNSADAGYEAGRFVAEVGERLRIILDAVGQGQHPGASSQPAEAAGAKTGGSK